jgi:GAF domain-containing protein
MTSELTKGRSLSARAERAQELAVPPLQPTDRAVLDELVAAAAERFGGVGVNVSVLTDCQISVAGRSPGGTPVERGLQTDFEDSICVNALRTDEALVIPDTRADARVSSIPAVADGPVRSYLGSAIRTNEGVVAVLCVYGTEPRQWTEDDLAELSGLADAVRTELLRLAG